MYTYAGFRRKELKVQLTPTRILKVSGEQKTEGNNNNNRSRRRRFQKEFSVPKDIDTNAISAKFESGNLHVKLPKVLNNIPSKLPQTTTHEKVDNQEVINPPKPRDYKAKAKEEANKSTDDELISQKKDQNENVIPCLNYSAKEAIVGLLVKLKKHKNLANLLLIVAILLVILVLGFALDLITMQSKGGISMLINGNRSAEVCDHTLTSSHV